MHDVAGPKNYYELLGVRPGVGEVELRRAYEATLNRANRDGALKHMLEIVQAYETLADPGRRRLYDETGRPVRSERTPNTFGTSVPFRGGQPALGQGRQYGPARRVIAPTARRPRSCTTRNVLGSLTVLAVTTLVTLGANFWSDLSRPAVPPVIARKVAVNAILAANGRVRVSCSSASEATYAFWALRGQTVTCSNGATPSWTERKP